MKRTIPLALLVIAVMVLATGTANAQRHQHHRHHQPSHYDPTTVEAFSAVLVEVQRQEHEEMDHVGIHLLVERQGSEVVVHLGPDEYLIGKGLLDESGGGLETGATLEITGSKVEVDGESLVIAKTVQYGDLTVELRDDRGKPMWSGMGRAGKGGRRGRGCC